MDCPLYKLTSKRRLAEILFSSPHELKDLASGSGYNCFIDNSGGKSRHIQQPLGDLDRIHSRVASLLCRIKAFDGLHSGIKGRSNVTNARAHLGANRRMVTVDLSGFFQSTSREMVFDFFFDTMKCVPDVADLLSDLLTYDSHVPTGSRVSMPLAYFANKKMFDEMQCFAVSIDAVMTIYVDDITLSGSNVARSSIYKLGQIACKYGHNLKAPKSRFFDARQVKLVTGTAIRDSQLAPRNKHLERLYDDMRVWLETDNVKEKAAAADSILGRLNYAGSIDSKYKDKARSFRAAATTEARLQGVGSV